MLDIGCGTADILEFLPEVIYTGIDSSADYIDAAKANWGRRGKFRQTTVEAVEAGSLGRFDLVLGLGVLHHLPDASAKHLIELAYDSLEPGGRFVTFDACFRERQSFIARWLLKNDRGAFVRTEPEYLALAAHRFEKITTCADCGSLRIPYGCLAMECYRP